MRSREELNGSSHQCICLCIQYERLNAFFSEYAQSIRRGWIDIRSPHPLPDATRFLLKLRVPTVDEPLHLEAAVSQEEPGASMQAEFKANIRVHFIFPSDEAKQGLHQRVTQMMNERFGLPLSERLLCDETDKVLPA